MVKSQWLYEGKPFNPSLANEYFGFVYLITNTITGRMYIGRKYFTSYRRKKVTGKIRRKKIVKSSGWETYFGSCKPLLADVKKFGEDKFRREILSLHKTKGRVNYTEIKEQFCRDVLYSKLDNGARMYYNDNILGRYFAPKETL